MSKRIPPYEVNVLHATTVTEVISNSWLPSQLFVIQRYGWVRCYNLFAWERAAYNLTREELPLIPPVHQITPIILRGIAVGQLSFGRFTEQIIAINVSY
jgi:hypothetical protein